MSKVFFDPSGRRQKRVLWILTGFLTATLLLLGMFWFDLEHLPFRPAPDLVRRLALAPEQDFGSPKAEDSSVWKRWWRPMREKISEPAGNVMLGFFDPEDESSRISLEAHGGQLTHLAVPGWKMSESGLEPEPIFRRLDEEKVSSGLSLLPILANDEGGMRVPEPVETLLRLPVSEQQKFIQALLVQAQEWGVPGMMVDWGEIDPRMRDAMTGFLQRLGADLHAKKIELWVILPVGRELEVFDLDAISGFADRMVAMLHDETGEEDSPGPIASLDWFEGWLKAMMSYGRPEQWILSLGLHGYDWEEGKKRGETIGFYDALARARWAGLPRIEPQPHSDQPHFAYRQEGRRHEVWFLDSVTLANQLEILRPYSPGGIGLWKLGLEDRDIWKILAKGISQKLRPVDLPTAVRPFGAIADVGDGDALSPYLEEKEGRRTFEVLANGAWRGRYDPLPQPASVMHSGAADPKMVALTFDDGPDPVWTPQILDILREKKVSATFFVVGKQAEMEPGLVRRILDEGHELGNHTFTHPNLAEVPEHQIRLELSATRRLIEDLTGRSLLLFRPPYQADSNPQSPEELRPLRVARDLGYLTIGQSIDSRDWERPGAEEIRQAVEEGRSQGQTILLHDSGGDRSQTVAALPGIIDFLQSRGDHLVTVGTMLGLRPDETMPRQSGELSVTSWMSCWVFWGWRTIQKSLTWFLILTTSLLALRLGLVWRASRRPAKTRIPERFHGVSVVLPAFNESKVIGSTLRHLAASRYPGEIEFLVIDDGSTDDTAGQTEAMISRDSRFRLLRQPNRGKAAALNLGLATARYPWVVTLDADTHFGPCTLAELVQPLGDEKVGAVSGRVRVGNRRRFLPALQELEYSSGFHLDRAAYAKWDCITVVPGAVSAYRAEVVRSLGGFSEDTLAEDADLTLALHAAGWKVAYAPQAVAWTEAPATVGGLLRQRRRWTYGTLQSIWKHRSLLFSGSKPWLGWVALPSLILTQTFLAVAVPLVDLGVLVSVWQGRAAEWLPWCLALSLMLDALPVAVALRRDGESWKKLMGVFWLRTVYRPLLAVAVWAALWKAVTGRWTSWKKLDRSAEWAMPQAS